MAAGRDLSQHSQWSLERKSKYARGAYFSLKKKKKREWRKMAASRMQTHTTDKKNKNYL